MVENYQFMKRAQTCSTTIYIVILLLMRRKFITSAHFIYFCVPELILSNYPTKMFSEVIPMECRRLAIASG